MLRELFRSIVVPLMAVAIIGVIIFVGFMIKDSARIAELKVAKEETSAPANKTQEPEAPELPGPEKSPEPGKAKGTAPESDTGTATSMADETQVASAQAVPQVKQFPAEFTVKLSSAPYPYHGTYPDTGKDFYDYTDKKTGVKYHTNRYGNRYEEKGHYDDSSVLFYIPPAFDPSKKFEILIYFHGNNADLKSEMAKYKIKEQVRKSARNVILIAPELVKNAVDSSPGRFFKSGAFPAFIKEASEDLTAALGEKYKDKISGARIIFMAFSGGYKAIAYILDSGDLAPRISGVILLDAMFEDVDKFKRFFKSNPGGAFLVSLYADGCEANNKELMSYLASNKLKFRTDKPVVIRKGDLYFNKAETEHLQLPLAGPPREPIANILKIIQG